MINTNYWTKKCLALLIVGIIASTTSFADKGSKMNQTNQKIDALFKQTKPVCFGRFIIQVPVNAKISWGETIVEYSISAFPGDGSKIRELTQAKIEEIKAIKHNKEPLTLIGIFDGPNKDSKVVVGYTNYASNRSAQLHSFIKIDKNGFIQEISNAPLSSSTTKFIFDKKAYTGALIKMQNIASVLRSRSDENVPTEPGICIEAGFIPEAEGKYREMTSIGFSFPEYPDVRFSISTIRKEEINPQSSLENIMKNAKEEAGLFGLGSLFNQIKILRKGERKIGDWDGAEQLSWMPPDEKGMPWTHEFKFKSIGVANDMFRPYIDMELSTGVSKNSRGVNEPSLKDDEAIELWDKLTASIQTRSTK